MARETTFYSELGKALEAETRSSEAREKISLGKTILRLRERAGLTGAELCRRSGGVDPRTLNAIERGRIRNPSLESLQAIARGLECLVRDLVTEAELEIEKTYYQGSQKGAFQIEFPKFGLRVVSATPPNRQFFCGKMIFAPKRGVEGRLLVRSGSLFVEVVMGRMEVTIENRTASLKEGENLFFDGSLRHAFKNSLNRESTLWLVASPSFLRP